MKYFILKATVRGERKTVLISEDEFIGSPSDYFVGSPSDAKKVGTVFVDGDTDELDGWYESN